MRFELCSFSGASTRAPSGKPAATEPSRGAEEPPSDTHSWGTESSAATDARVSCVSVSQLPNDNRPSAHAAVMVLTAATAAGGGTPKLAVLRYPRRGSQGARVME